MEIVEIILRFLGIFLMIFIVIDVIIKNKDMIIHNRYNLFFIYFLFLKFSYALITRKQWNMEDDITAIFKCI